MCLWALMSLSRNFFKEKFSITPLKNVELNFTDIKGDFHSKSEELLVSKDGVEGNLI
jgi:predicted flavoprotein YhiN